MRLSFAALSFATLGTEVLDPAFVAAAKVSPSWSRTRGGWMRLARVKGTAKKPYVIAVRRCEGSRGFQFACGCAHWRNRLNAASVRGAEHKLCKHQERFLREAVKVDRSIEFFESGLLFVRAIAEELGLDEDAAIFGNVRTIAEAA